MNATESKGMSILEMLTTCWCRDTQVFFIYFNQIFIPFNSVHSKYEHWRDYFFIIISCFHLYVVYIQLFTWSKAHIYTI